MVGRTQGIVGRRTAYVCAETASGGLRVGHTCASTGVHAATRQPDSKSDGMSRGHGGMS